MVSTEVSLENRLRPGSRWHCLEQHIHTWWSQVWIKRPQRIHFWRRSSGDRTWTSWHLEPTLGIHTEPGSDLGPLWSTCCILKSTHSLLFLEMLLYELTLKSQHFYHWCYSCVSRHGILKGICEAPNSLAGKDSRFWSYLSWKPKISSRQPVPPQTYQITHRYVSQGSWDNQRTLNQWWGEGSPLEAGGKVILEAKISICPGLEHPRLSQSFSFPSQYWALHPAKHACVYVC